MTIRAEGTSSAQGGLLIAQVGFTGLPHREFRLGDDGVALVENVALGDYTILIFDAEAGESHSRAGKLEHFGFTGSEVAVATAPGQTVRVRPVLAENASGLMGVVYYRGHMLFELAPSNDGMLEAGGLPQGEYGVMVSARIDGQRVWARGIARTGEVLDIEIGPRDK
jgi:hypothetical protein